MNLFNNCANRQAVRAAIFLFLAQQQCIKKITTKPVALFVYFTKAEAIEASSENRHTNGGSGGRSPRTLKNFLKFLVLFLVFS